MKQARKYNLDILRIIAALAVVLFHVLGSSANNDPEVPQNIHSLATAFSSILQWHVPVFFMITGYLWLSDEKICTFKKMLPNIRRFVFVLFTFGLVYAIMERFFVTRTVSVALLRASLQDVLNGNLWDHMWFVYAILGIYIVLPVFKPFFVTSSKETITVFSALLYLFTIIFPILKSEIGYSVPIGFPIGKYMFYIFAGGLIAKWNPTQVKAAIISISLFLCSIFTVLFIKIRVCQYEGYISLFTCISAVSLFIAVTVFMNDIPSISWIRKVSDCTFGIYLIHPLFINIMLKLLHIYPLRYLPFLSITGTWIAIVGLSYISTCFLRKISWIKKYLL